MLDALSPTFRIPARGALPAPLIVGLVLVTSCGGGRGGDGEGADTVAVRTQPAPAPSTGGAAPAAAEGVGAAQPVDSPAVAPADTPASRAPGDPDWMTVDEKAKSVTFDVVAGFNTTNSAWNFNGHANGDMTIVVPEGWRVVLGFSNRDASVPHSLLVSPREPPFPQVFEPETAFTAAYTSNPQAGLAAGRTDQVRFTASKTGRFTMPCGVPGHAASGMWDWFEVSADAARPRVETAA